MGFRKVSPSGQPSFLLAEGTVEAAVLLPLPQLGKQGPAGGAQLVAGLRARRRLSVGAHLAARCLLGDVLVDGHVGDVRGEASKIPPVARRRGKPLEWLRPPLRPGAPGHVEARLRVAAGQTPVAPPLVSDWSLLQEEGLLVLGAATLIRDLLAEILRLTPRRCFDAADK